MAAIEVVTADNRAGHGADAADDDLASSLLAQAFADDPVMLWTQPDRSKHRAMHAALLRWVHARAYVDIARRDGIGVGAAIWDPPGVSPSSRETVRALLTHLRLLGPRIVRGATVERMCEARRPAEPHWYLAELGAAVQGMGVGTTLLRAGVDRVDGLAYLESSNEVNVPLYERFGFQVTGEIHLPRGGPTLWTMERRG